MSFLTDETLFSGTISDSDLIHLVDVSDTKQNLAGSSYKLTIGQLKTAIPTIYSADGTLSGARVVTQAGFALSFVGGNVGIGVSSGFTAFFQAKSPNPSGGTLHTLFQNSSNDNLFSIYDNGKTSVGTINSFGLFNVGTDTNGAGMFLTTIAGRPLGGFQKTVNGIPVGYLALYDSNADTQLSFNSHGYTQSDFINTGLNLGIGSDFNVSVGATAKLHVQGIDTTSSNYAFKADDLAGNPLLYVRNDGVVSMPTLPTSSVGLVAGDLWNNGGVINIV